MSQRSGIKEAAGRDNEVRRAGSDGSNELLIKPSCLVPDLVASRYLINVGNVTDSLEDGDLNLRISSLDAKQVTKKLNIKLNSSECHFEYVEER